MVERVGDDGVLCRQKRLEHTAVRVEAGGVQDGVFGVEIVGNGFFKLFVEILRPADEADGGHAVAARLHRFLCRGDEPRAVGEAEVVVGAEVQGLASVLEGDFRALGGSDVAFFLVEAGFLDGGELSGEMLLE